MTEADGPVPAEPGSSIEKSISELRRKVNAIDATVGQLRVSKIDVPQSLIAERYDMAKRLAMLERRLIVAEATTSKGVFVIMPFREPFDSYYKSVIQPAGLDAGFEITRSDEIYSPGAFVQTLWLQILKAEAVIAEMTGANPNVLYELGLCHAIDKKVIIIAQSISDIPADLRHMNSVVYDTTQVNWAEKLRSSIQRMLLFDQGQARNTILYPVASVDNTRLFEQMQNRLEALSLELQMLGSELEGVRESLVSTLEERNQLHASLNAKSMESSNLTPNRVSFIEDDDIEVATVTISGDNPIFLDFVQVPAGDFVFGNGAEAQSVWLPDYWINRYSITNAQYCAFLEDVGLEVEQGVPWINLSGSSPGDRCRIIKRGRSFVVEEGYENHPVTYVNYYGADAFSQWIGGSLPSAEQWEKAARGTDGREYPWGANPPNPDLANTTPSGWARDVPPIPVRSKKKGMSPFGMVQPIGNVWHWTSTFFPERGVQAVRGGSFFDFRVGRKEVYRFQVHPDGPDFSQGFVITRRFMI